MRSLTFQPWQVGSTSALPSILVPVAERKHTCRNPGSYPGHLMSSPTVDAFTVIATCSQLLDSQYVDPAVHGTAPVIQS